MHVAAKIWNPSFHVTTGCKKKLGNMAKPGVETTDAPWGHGQNMVGPRRSS